MDFSSGLKKLGEPNDTGNLMKRSLSPFDASAIGI